MTPEPTTPIAFGDLDAAEPLPGFFVRRIDGEEIAVQEVRLNAGHGSDFAHAHPHEQFLLMVEGRLRLSLGEGDAAVERELTAGDVLHLPGGLRHGRIWAVENCRFVDVFGPPKR